MTYLDMTQESYQEEFDVSLLQLCCNRLENTHIFVSTQVIRTEKYSQAI